MALASSPGTEPPRSPPVCRWTGPSQRPSAFRSVGERAGPAFRSRRRPLWRACASDIGGVREISESGASWLLRLGGERRGEDGSTGDKKCPPSQRRHLLMLHNAKGRSEQFGESLRDRLAEPRARFTVVRCCRAGGSRGVPVAPPGRPLFWVTHHHRYHRGVVSVLSVNLDRRMPVGGSA